MICDSIPEPLEFHLGPGKALQLITLTFWSGGLHYSATRLIIRAGLVITQKRSKREMENASNTQDGASQQGKSKQAKGSTSNASKKEISRAQRWATVRSHLKKNHSNRDKRAAA